MDSPPEPLKPREHQRLRAIVERDAPELVSVAEDTANARWLTDEEAKVLIRVLLNVFLGSLDQDDEPSRDGVEADRLAGRVEMQRRGYWVR